LKTILIVGSPSYAGAVLARKYLKAGYTIKVQEGYIYRNDIFSETDLNTICNDNLNIIDDDLGNKEKLSKIVAGCNVIIYFAQTVSEHDSGFEYDSFISMVDNANDCGVQRFIYVSSYSVNATLYVEYLKKMALDNLTAIIVNDSGVYCNPLEQKREISVEIFSKYATNKQKITLFGKKRKDISNRVLQKQWYANSHLKSEDSYADCKAELYLALSEHTVNKLEKKSWQYIVTCRILLKQLFVLYKFYEILRHPFAYFIGYTKLKFCMVRRCFDILMMMFLIHFWPEQTYRFSTRKMLHDKERRYQTSDRPIIPFELVESRTSDIPRMKEANIVLRGSSFDIKQLEELDFPTFLVSFWEPVQTKKEVTYVMGRAKNALRLGKLGHKVIHTEVSLIGYDGNITPSETSNYKELWYNQFVEDGTCKRISISENLYHGLPKPPYCLWAPFTSGIHGIISLSYFADKINVYGWDYYLESSPDSMSYWQLYFNLMNLKDDITFSSLLFETSIANFYYGYHLSKLTNINIHGYLGQLGRHEKLIGKLERVLFNP
jgi:hypothetical protein